ncbi:hypothetical protein [Mycolicibacterium sp.]|uniref:hypothetical protein n=1 Tax=Mycolicibacterium sp. TaxID=2320850 RepID=UPI0037C659A4
MRENSATTTPQFNAPLPAGADPTHVDNWERFDRGFYRLVWSEPMPLPERLAPHHDIRVVCTQVPDGTVVTDDPANEGPFVYFCDQDHTPGGVRALAQALLAAADLADRWAGVQR